MFTHRNLLIGVAAAGLLSNAGVSAADFPSRLAPPPPPPPSFDPTPVVSWTGLYVGLNAGVDIRTHNNPVFEAGGLFPSAASNLVPNVPGSGTGFTTGAQIGYNLQAGSFVYGAEADINYRDPVGSMNGTFPTNPVGYGAAFPSYTLTGFNRDDWFGTVRGRFGFASDRALFYVTGGLAYGQTGGGAVTVNSAAGPGVAFTTAGAAVRAGWALGGGFEYAIASNWTVKGEYLHVDLGTNTSVYSAGGGALTYTLRRRNTDDIVRVGVNYKFGGPVIDTVVAKY
jgi:opacity protein-like surface antigen